MGFLAPLMLLGGVFLLLPIVIHLMGRRRAKVVPFAAMDFLFSSERRTSKHLRLREFLLLLARALICLCIPLVMAKPFTSCETRGPLVVRGPQAAVLIIDDSFLSAYRVAGTSLIARATNQALSILDKLGPEADIAVIATSEGTVSPSALSRDHLGARDVIGDIEVTSRVADTTTALRRAVQLLSASIHERRTIYLISPLAASGFRGAPAAVIADRGIDLTVIDVTEGVVPDNLAVTDIRVERDASAGSRGVEVTTRIANFGAQGAAGHGVELRIDGSSVAKGTVSVAAGSAVDKRFFAAVPGTSRFADIAVHLARDPLVTDNRRYLRVELREEVRVLLVNGDPRTIRYDDELFYLSAALRPGDRADSGTLVTTCLADELDDIRLTDFDVIALVNVRALDEDRVARLSSWVKRGGGLLVAPGSNTDADAYNKTMVPLMPQTVKDAIAVSYGTRGQERIERALRLAKWEAGHPIFSVFSGDAAGLSEARFDTIMLLGTTTRVDDRRVLARYTNGAAALVEARSGRGWLMMFTSTLDRDWNDLAIHPGYLPLWQQTVRYLARKQERRARSSILVGKSTVLSVTGEDARLQVAGPDDRRSVIEGEELAGRKFVRFGETLRPGFYRVTAVDQQGAERRRVEADFAVNLDTRGSDASPIDRALLLPGEDGASGSGPAVHTRRVELWHSLAGGLLLLLLLESLLIRRR